MPVPAGYVRHRKTGKLHRIKRGGLNPVEQSQVRNIAKQQVRLRSETKHRAWLYPKTTYSELLHNKPFFLFGGDDARNGLLNLDQGDQSRPTPEGGGLPVDKPGQCREGESIRLQALTHNCILSGDNANKNTMVRMIMFSYPTQQNGITEADILLQPTDTGAGQGFPNIFLSKNTYNNKGVRFLLDRTYQLNGVTSGAIVEAEDTAVNWGLSGVRTFRFNKYFKNGRKIKYTDKTGEIIPAVDNYGIMIIPYGSGVTEQDEKCGRIEILGDMLFKDL
jgi:hypothetical protein